MKTNNNQRFRVLILLLAFSLSVIAQKSAKLIKSESFITIKGTSTLHDWEEKTTQYDCDLVLQTKGNELVSFDKATLKCIAKSIVSEHTLMNTKTYEALKANSYPELKFVLKKVEKLVSNNGQISCNIIGDVNIAGVTKSISIPITGTIQNNILKIKGSEEINMPEYGIEPPTAVMGTIKTGQKVAIEFSLSFII